MTDAPIRLLHITDPHLHAHTDARMRGLNTFESCQAVIESVLAGPLQPDAVIATGDLVQDETRQGYERFVALLSPLGVPVHCIPGNHDSPRIMAEMLSSPPFHFCGTGIYGNWCLVMLNSAIRWDDGGRLDEDQLQTLEDSLRRYPDHYALVALHHHPLPTGSLWLDGLSLRNSAEFLAVLDRFPMVRAVAWGHVHQARQTLRNGALMFSTPSTGSQFLPNSDAFMMDSKPPGYRWINLLPDGSINTEVVWLS
ncbi:MAG: 3',5'-cyclic-AMP phosphodiesterase [Gammaproteobacteria bacterium]|nr:3',5'-cyclic-AMP phosphodiesterase [Gammaproteobacteria bacterium]